MMWGFDQETHPMCLRNSLNLGYNLFGFSSFSYILKLVRFGHPSKLKIDIPANLSVELMNSYITTYLWPCDGDQKQAKLLEMTKELRVSKLKSKQATSIDILETLKEIVMTAIKNSDDAIVIIDSQSLLCNYSKASFFENLMLARVFVAEILLGNCFEEDFRIHLIRNLHFVNTFSNSGFLFFLKRSFPKILNLNTGTYTSISEVVLMLNMNKLSFYRSFVKW
ncbi:hypothetical protein [Parapedobacter indicus]|uniref:Uncharacterized protein n=1 Tax=Parapedobacter indicus TaxID=1477437 RepID=A0A1I3HTA3_9SPHI|nr:hypothetical protein [Parapedobacter indicus]PPL03156.1 hypothetical protein CLV26_103482 [Parapedobacter indicus]SFI38839.1 hypothetical protein SAMN05444682_103481 [Parapedobacter indicus]